jgi:hypothetical protein
MIREPKDAKWSETCEYIFTPGSAPYLALTSAAPDRLLPERKNWPSDDELVPAPQWRANGS